MPSVERPRQDCPNMTSCSMYSLLQAAGTLSIWKANFCQASFERCERYRLLLIGHPVPPNLLPTGVLLRHLGDRK